MSAGREWPRIVSPRDPNAVPWFFSAPPRVIRGGFYLLFVYATIPNLPFWIANSFLLSAPRPYVNLDYLLIAMISMYLPAGATVLLFTLAWIVDVGADSMYFYYFSQHDFVASILFLGNIQFGRVLIAGMALICSGLAFEIGLRRLTRGFRSVSRVSVVILSIGIISLIALAAVLSSTQIVKRDVYRSHSLSNSVSFSCLRIAFLRHIAPPSSHSGIKINSATKSILQELSSHDIATSRKRNLVVILIEAYGLIDDRQMQNRLLSPFTTPEIAANYNVQISNVAFRGPTVSGEFRELCGLQLDLSSASSVASFSESCLPKLATKAGYKTLAIHGFSRYMFDRGTWWPEMGFQSTLFLEDLQPNPKTHLCSGPFPGVCDTDMGNIVGEKLLSSRGDSPNLIYWVTLNSHLPIQKGAAETSAVCGGTRTDIPDEGICLWAALVYRVNQSIANIATLPGLPQTEFVVVGDHAPPFLFPARRERFSQTDVPVVHLVPKTL